jgi:hypothetical protein
MHGAPIPVLPFAETSVLCHHLQTFAWLERRSGNVSVSKDEGVQEKS